MQLLSSGQIPLPMTSNWVCQWVRRFRTRSSDGRSRKRPLLPHFSGSSWVPPNYNIHRVPFHGSFSHRRVAPHLLCLQVYPAGTVSTCLAHTLGNDLFTEVFFFEPCGLDFVSWQDSATVAIPRSCTMTIHCPHLSSPGSKFTTTMFWLDKRALTEIP